MNLTAAAVRPINEALKKSTVRAIYPHQVNFIEAIATMKKAVVSFLSPERLEMPLSVYADGYQHLPNPLRSEESSSETYNQSGNIISMINLSEALIISIPGLICFIPAMVVFLSKGEVLLYCTVVVRRLPDA